MPKKCTICGKPAEFCVKNSSECYCLECAEEHFGDLSYLEKIESEAKALKSFIESAVQTPEEIKDKEKKDLEDVDVDIKFNKS